MKLGQGKLRAFLALAVVRGLGAASILVLYLIAAHTYTPEVSGHLFFLITLSTMAMPAMLTGLNTFAVKRGSVLEGTEAKKPFVVSLLWVFVKYAVGLAAVAVTGTLGWAIFTGADVSIVLIVFSVVFTIPLFSLIGSLLQADKRYNQAIFVLNIANYIILSLLILFCALTLDTTRWTAAQSHLIFAVAAALTLLCSIALLMRHYRLSRAEMTSLRSAYKLSAPEQKQRRGFWAVLVLININIWLPQITYYAMGARADYAYFSVAERLANAINFFVVISNFFLAPIISELYHKNKIEELKEYAAKVTRIITVCCLPVAAVMIFGAHWVLLAFGHRYVAGATYLAIMTGAQLFNVAMGSVNPILNMTGSEGLLIRSILIAFVLEFICLVTLAPLFGGLGYAIAYAVNLVTQTSIAAVMVRRTIGFNVSQLFDIRGLFAGLRRPVGSS